MKNFVLKGNICHSAPDGAIYITENAYLVCENGLVAGVFETLPTQYQDLPLTDHGDKLLIPGLSDLHIHAPQFSFRGLGMDMELLDWLDSSGKV